MRKRPTDRHGSLPTVSRLRRTAAKARAKTRRSLRRAGMLMPLGPRSGGKNGKRS